MEFKNVVTLGGISIGGKGSYGIGASAVNFKEDLPTYLRITDISKDGYLLRNTLKSIDDPNAGNYILKPNDIIFARTGNSTGKSYFYDGTDSELIYAGFLIKFSLDETKVNPKFIRYYTLSEQYKGWVKGFSTGSTRGNINAKSYANMQINLPSREHQNFIVNILSSFEEKYKLNNSIILNLEQLAQTLFKRWFVDFEFPNENGDPYKSSGGEMVESELGMIPRNWSAGKLKDISTNFDKKRIPLSKLERLKRESIYPYYGAASLMDYVDDYIFDGVHLLIGEDGSVIDKDGFPILQYVWGKFWVNNHAHVLKGKEIFTEEYIYLLLKKTNVTNIVTGAVQPKINQTNLNNIKVVVPEREVLKLFNKFISPIFNKVRLANDENSNLEKLRDTLLPRLLSGEIKLPNETEVTEDVPIS